MKVTRKQILRVIRTENLKANEFIHSKYDNEKGFIFDKTCEVCAVGGVLRKMGIAGENIEDKAWDVLGWYNTANHEGNEIYALKDKNYLLALSIKFEKLARRLGNGKRTRKQLADFVKVNFPKVINIDL